MSGLYPLLMLASLALCSLLLRRSQKTLGLPAWQRRTLVASAFCGAMIGAKLPFLLADWEGLMTGAAWLAHGKTIMCGILGGYFAVEVAKWTLEIRVKTGDTFAFPCAVAVAVGRLGCFQGGCCYGVPTELPWGVCFATAPEPLVTRHPTQLYEFAFHALAAAALYWLGARGAFRGQLLKLYIMAYLLYRFGSEWLRPEARMWLQLTAYQWAAAAMLPLFAWLWVRDHNAAQANRQPKASGALAESNT